MPPVSENTTPAARTPRFVLPVLAGILSLAVGVITFLVTSPLAAPRTVDPAVVQVEQVPMSDGFESLEDAAASEPGPYPVVTYLDTDAHADARAAIAEVLAERDAAAVGEESPTPEPESYPGLTVIDPCPEADGGACPDGIRGTVLATVPELHVVLTPATADDCRRNTTQTAFGFRVVTNLPGTVTIRWEDVTEQTRTTRTPNAQREQFDAGERDTVVHCFDVSGLTPGWSGTVSVVVTSDDGQTATLLPTYSASPAAIVPPSFVEPVTRSSILVSVPTTSVSTERFRAIVVPFGQPAPACDFGDGVAGVIEPIEVVNETFTPEYLAERNYERFYVERHTALFVVPEASTISICAGMVDAHGWTGVIPDRVYSEVWYSPDLMSPVLTVEGFEPAPGVRATGVELTANIRGFEEACGTWRLFDDDGLLCDQNDFDGSAEWWDDVIEVSVTGSALGSTGTRDYELVYGPLDCGLGCELPEPRVWDARVSFRDPCIGNCPDSYLGIVRVRVEWEHGTRSWFDDWLAEDGPAPASRLPLLDTAAEPFFGSTVGADGEQFAQVVLETDVRSDIELQVYRLREGHEPELVDTDRSDATGRSHTMTFGPLRGGGNYYALTAIVTGQDGSTATYSGMPGVGRSWVNGWIVTEPAEVPMTVEVTVTSPDGGEAVVGTTRLQFAGAHWFEERPRITDTVCGPSPFIVPLNGDVAVPVFARDPAHSFRLDIELADVDDADLSLGGCQWRGTRPTQSFTGLLPYDDLLDGIAVRSTNADGYTVTIVATPAG